MENKILEQLAEEFDMKESIANPDPGKYEISFKNEIKVNFFDDPDGIHLNAIIGDCPKEGVDGLLSKVLEANLFGESTNHGVIGLSRDGKMLTLSQDLDYNVAYSQFKEKIEDFLNVIELWRNELLKRQ